MSHNHTIKTKHVFLTSAILLMIIAMPGRTQSINPPENLERSGWFIKPYVGYSQLSDQRVNAINAGSLDGDWEVNSSGGFTAGLGLGYRYNSRFSTELYWEYRSNDTDTQISNSEQIFSGNYASNLIYLNGYYHFAPKRNWQPYLGIGAGWVQEIDIDLEDTVLERSFSDDGELSMQVMAGIDYPIYPGWTVNAEIRYAFLSSLQLNGEENASGQVSGFDYNPLTLGIGLKYAF